MCPEIINQPAAITFNLASSTWISNLFCLLSCLLFRGLASSSNSATDPSDEHRLLLLSTDTLLPLPALPALISWGTGSLERERPLSIRDGEANMSLLIFLWLLGTKEDLMYICKSRKWVQLPTNKFYQIITSQTDTRLSFSYQPDPRSHRLFFMHWSGINGLRKWIHATDKKSI